MLLGCKDCLFCSLAPLLALGRPPVSIYRLDRLVNGSDRNIFKYLILYIHKPVGSGYIGKSRSEYRIEYKMA